VKDFVIIATATRGGDLISYELNARISVRALSLTDAYRQVRKFPEFKFAHLRPE
jgi:hypothetical protein